MRSKWLCSLATILLGLALGCAQQASSTPACCSANAPCCKEGAPCCAPTAAPAVVRGTSVYSGSGQITISGEIANTPHPGQFMARGAWGGNDGHPWQDGAGGRFGRPGRPFMPPQPATQKVAYLGVAVSPVGPALGEQLNLAKGMGLLVDHVEKDSPAEAAGIKQYDVVQLLGDQMIVDEHQFSVLIRGHKAGDQINLTVIHQGKPTSVSAKLVEKEIPVMPRPGPGQGKRQGMGRGMGPGMGPGMPMMPQRHGQGGRMGGPNNARGGGPMHSFSRRPGDSGWGSQRDGMSRDHRRPFGNEPPQIARPNGPGHGEHPQGGPPRGNPQRDGPQHDGPPHGGPQLAPPRGGPVHSGPPRDGAPPRPDNNSQRPTTNPAM